MDLASELKLLIYMGPHSNIVNLLASCTIRGDLWVVMEFCDHGDLKKFLSDRRHNFNPSWSKDSADISTSVCLYDLHRMCEQIVNGVMFLHHWNVVHRDLSARNILVDSNFNLKIADFGLARSNDFVASEDDVMPIKWTALESLLRHEYSTKSDIWSVGILMWEIFSLGEIPYPGMNSKEVIKQLKEGYRMDPPFNCPTEIFSMMSDCWAANPENRPTAEELFLQLDELKVSIVSAPDGQYYGHNDECGDAGTIQGPSIDEIQKTILEQEYKRASQTADNEESKSIVLLSSENRQQQDENQPSNTEVEDLKNKIRGIIDQKHLQLQEQINQIEQVLTISTHKDSNY